MKVENVNKILVGLVVISLLVTAAQYSQLRNMHDNYEKHQDSYWRQVYLSVDLSEKNTSFDCNSAGNGCISGNLQTEQGIIQYGYAYVPSIERTIEGEYTSDDSGDEYINGILIKIPWD